MVKCHTKPLFLPPGEIGDERRHRSGLAEQRPVALELAAVADSFGQLGAQQVVLGDGKPGQLRTQLAVLKVRHARA